MSALNHIGPDPTYRKMEPQVLIELPQPIADDCTIIMNGHHNLGMCSEKDFSEETQPLFDPPPSVPNSASVESSNCALSTDGFPLKGSFLSSSHEEDSDAEIEPESSTHLLQNEGQSYRSPKGPIKFRSSPSKKNPSSDSHSHIQHRPLGLAQNTLPDAHTKRSWSFSSIACMVPGICMILLALSLAIGLFVSKRFRGFCPKKQWWEGTVVYEIFPASYQDTDGDGFGDMLGVVERLEYIQHLNVQIIHLNSIFSALDYPLEYEHVIDFANLDPHLGRIEDFRRLVREVHQRGMRLILDMNPSVTSDQHTWAAHWLLHRPGPFQHFYVNVTDREGEEPPLEYNPEFSKQSWTSPHRTFGSHLYLNWSNPLLRSEMGNVVDQWLFEGIDGFYMKHLKKLHLGSRNDLVHVLRAWRSILDKHSVNSTQKVLVLSQEDVEYLQDILEPVEFTKMLPSIDVVDVSLRLSDNSSCKAMVDTIQRIERFWKQRAPALVWHLGSVETMRMSGMLGARSSMAGFFLLAFLPGSMTVFYGDEIGMQNLLDPVTEKVFRGGQLTPMQWTSGPQANFTTEGFPQWLPVHPDYSTRNVDTHSSVLSLFSTLISLKNRSPLFAERNADHSHQWWSCQSGLVAAVHTDSVLIANFGNETVVIGQCGGELGDFGIDIRTVRVAISTMDLASSDLKLKDMRLDSGHALIGQILN